MRCKQKEERKARNASKMQLRHKSLARLKVMTLLGVNNEKKSSLRTPWIAAFIKEKQFENERNDFNASIIILLQYFLWQISRSSFDIVSKRLWPLLRPRRATISSELLIKIIDYKVTRQAVFLWCNKYCKLSRYLWINLLTYKYKCFNTFTSLEANMQRKQGY